MATVRETILWATTDGLRCVVSPYDENRFQLRLLRPTGTVRTELFADYATAVAASSGWLHQIREGNRVAKGNGEART